MIRLGLRLVFASREAVTRLVVIAASVAVCAVLLLTAATGLHAVNASLDRACWQCTHAVGQTAAPTAAPADGLLWLYRADYFRGREIQQVDVTAGPGHVLLLPGIARNPAVGEYFASPALVRLIHDTPPNQLADRFPATLAGTIGDSALSAPDALVAFVGQSERALLADPRTIAVRHIETGAQPRSYTAIVRVGFVIGGIAVLFPLALLVAMATRIASARRDERFAALRLVGATTRQVTKIAVVEALTSTVAGTAIGLGVFGIAQATLTATAAHHLDLFVPDLRASTIAYLVTAIVLPVIAVLGALRAIRSVDLDPLHVARRAPAATPGLRCTAPLLLGLVSFALTAIVFHYPDNNNALFLIGAQCLLTVIGLVVIGPFATARLAGRVAERTGRPAELIAARRVSHRPADSYRAVSGVVVALFFGTLLLAVVPSLTAGNRSPASIGLDNTLTVMFYNSETAGIPPAQGARLLDQLHSVSGLETMPIYGTSPAATQDRAATQGIVACQDLTRFSTLGRCADDHGLLQITTTPLVKDHDTAQLHGTTPATTTVDVNRLPLQALLIRSNTEPALIETARTLLSHRPGVTQDPVTFGEAARATQRTVTAVQHGVDLLVVITILIASCSITIAAIAGVVERRRSFTLMRISGTPVRVLNKAVIYEALTPLLATIAVTIATAYAVGAAALYSTGTTGLRRPPLLLVELVVFAVLAVTALTAMSLPMLNRTTNPREVRFE